LSALSDFISHHRWLFTVDHNNVFAHAFGKVQMKLQYLDLIQKRYGEASKQFIANSAALMDRATAMGEGQRDATSEEIELSKSADALRADAHLQIESFYLFAKMLLDDIARALEYYFGQARDCSLDTHDDFTKKLQRYATAKDLTIPKGLKEATEDLKRRVCDVRDVRITHEKSPRTMKGTVSGGEAAGVRMIMIRLYPSERDEQFETEDLTVLRSSIDSYLELIIKFIEDNHERTKLSRMKAS
jgi:hypothetical protein